MGRTRWGFRAKCVERARSKLKVLKKHHQIVVTCRHGHRRQISNAFKQYALCVRVWAVGTSEYMLQSHICSCVVVFLLLHLRSAGWLVGERYYSRLHICERWRTRGLGESIGWAGFRCTDESSSMSHLDAKNIYIRRVKAERNDYYRKGKATALERRRKKVKLLSRREMPFPLVRSSPISYDLTSNTHTYTKSSLVVAATQLFGAGFSVAINIIKCR